MIVETIKFLLKRVTACSITAVILVSLWGCQSTPTPPSCYFNTHKITPLGLKISALRWQWEDDVDPVVNTQNPDISPKAYLEAALSHGLACKEPTDDPLLIQVRTMQWQERPETVSPQKTSLFAAEPGTIVRLDYDISVGTADVHGFQKQSINVQLYHEVNIPHHASLYERQSKLHELIQESCERLVQLLQERLNSRFPQLIVDSGL